MFTNDRYLLFYACPLSCADDLFYDSLTVAETLSVTALLRLPQAMTRAEKLRRVDVVIDVLGACRIWYLGRAFMRECSLSECSHLLTKRACQCVRACS